MQEQLNELLPTKEELSSLSRRLTPNPRRLIGCVTAMVTWTGQQAQRSAKSCAIQVWVALQAFAIRSKQRMEQNPHQSVAWIFLFGISIAFIGAFLSRYGSNMDRDDEVWMKLRGGGRNVAVTNQKIQKSFGTKLSAKELQEAAAPYLVLPDVYNYLIPSDLSSPMSSLTSPIGTMTSISAVPVMAYLPRSGGGTVTQIMGKCEGMTIGGLYRGLVGRVSPLDESLEVVHEMGLKQVVADFSTTEGRTQARDAGLKDIHELVVVTQSLIDSSQLFSGSLQAELWMWFRHPVQRQASLYYYRQSLPVGHPQYDPIMATIPLVQWAQTPSLHTPNAYMLALIGQPQNPMVGYSSIDLVLAKNVLLQKATIGLLEEKDESIRRLRIRNNFHHHHGSTNSLKDNALHETIVGADGNRACREELLDYAWPTQNRHPAISEEHVGYKVLAQMNAWDMQLYQYARVLFAQQGAARRSNRGNDNDD